MLQLGKMQVMEHEINRVGVDICGLAKVRWEGQGHFYTAGEHTVMYSGKEKRG